MCPVMLQLVPQNWSPRPFMAATAGPLGPFEALQMVPPDQLWRFGWSPFAIAGPRIIQRLLLFY